MEGDERRKGEEEEEKRRAGTGRERRREGWTGLVRERAFRRRVRVRHWNERVLLKFNGGEQ